MIRSILKIIVIGLVVLALGIQFVPYGRTHENPGVVQEVQWDSAATRDLFYRACGDCHSNETVWPWYSNIAPVSWLVQHDTEEGREELNVSEWNKTYRATREVSEAIQEGEMPPAMFTLMHPEARLTAEETNQLLKGLTATFAGK